MFVITYFNYAMLHASRSVWSAGTKDFKTLYKFEDYTIAGINTVFLASYGVCGFFSGQLADKYRKGRLIFALYTFTAIVQILLGFIKFIPADR